MGWMDGKRSEKTARANLPAIGSHVVVIDTVETFFKSGDQWTYGEVPRVVGRVMESGGGETHVGDEVGKMWFVNDTRDKWGYTRAEVFAFGKCIAESLGHGPEMVEALLRQLFNPDHEEQYKAFEKTQPIRGLALRWEVYQNGKYTEVKFHAIPQTKEQIKAQREKLEAWKAGKVPAQSTAAQPAAQSAPAATPAEPAPAPAPAAAPSLLAGLGQ